MSKSQNESPTTMLSIATRQNDDADFLALVNRVCSSATQQFHAKDVILVRTDHWFDHKWLGFSGKALGAIGVRNTRLTIPPFVPNRVISQETYSLNAGTGLYDQTDVPPLHLIQPSRENLTRFVDRVTKSGLFIWFSGDTKQTDIGSIMTYIVADNTQSAWYASFKKATTWQLNKVAGISKAELLQLTGKLLHEQNV